MTPWCAQSQRFPQSRYLAALNHHLADLRDHERALKRGAHLRTALAADAHTVARPEDIDDELRHLIAALASS